MWPRFTLRHRIARRPLEAELRSHFATSSACMILSLATKIADALEQIRVIGITDIDSTRTE
jgi:hypothetical protein